MLDHGHHGRDSQGETAVVDLPPGQLPRDAQWPAARGNPLAGSHTGYAAQGLHASGNILPPTTPTSTPSVAASAATISDPGQPILDIQGSAAGADLHDAILAILADAVDDLEAVRKATANRIESLTRVKGLAGTEFEAQLLAQLAQTKALERAAIRNLEAAMAAHPLGAFVASHHGIGLKSIGRLLAAIGDPAARANPAKLCQYCGHGDPERSRRRKGELVEFSPKAKTRLWIVAKFASNQGPYREVYEAARAAAEGKVHSRECRNTIRPVAGKAAGSNGCGTQAHPEWGEPGSQWRDGHKHGHALRVVGKTILLDLWKAAREVQA